MAHICTYIYMDEKFEPARDKQQMAHFELVGSGKDQFIAQPDGLCYLYLGFCFDHLSQHPNNKETWYSNVLGKDYCD